MVNIIKFSHDYPKLWGQKEARLIEVNLIIKFDNCNIERQLGKKLIEYDTKNCNGDYYKLPEDDLLQLIFLGDEKIPFCTLRRCTKSKKEYYDKKIDEVFKIVIQSLN